MNRSGKAFIAIMASLLSLIIVCVTFNAAVNKLSEGVSSMPSDNNQQNSGVNNSGYVDQNQYVQQPADTNTDVNAGVSQDSQPVQDSQQQVQQNTAQPQQNVQQQAQQQTGDNPLNYSKAQLINYYNQCLRKTYSQPKFTVTKTEVIDVQLGEMLLNGKPATGIQGLANKVVASNAAKGGTKTQNFTSSTAKVDAQKRFILPANLSATGVKSYSVKKAGAGYVMTFVLNPESCDFRTKPPYNSSCTFPLDFNEIDLGGIGEITSAQFYYPGTTLTATTDAQGRVIKTYVEMPLTVDNAGGKGMGQTLTVDISGKWKCTNINTF